MRACVRSCVCACVRVRVCVCVCEVCVCVGGALRVCVACVLTSLCCVCRESSDPNPTKVDPTKVSNPTKTNPLIRSRDHFYKSNR